MDVEGDRVLEAVRVDEPQLGQDLAEPPPVAHHDLGGAGEVGLREEPPAHEHLAEPLLQDVGVGVDDVPAAEAQALPLVAAHEGQGPAAPADVDLAQEVGDDAFGEVAVHAVGPGDPTP